MDLAIFVRTCTFLITISNLSPYLVFERVCFPVRQRTKGGVRSCFASLQKPGPGSDLASSLSNLDTYAFSLLTSNLPLLMTSSRYISLSFSECNLPDSARFVTIWTISVHRSFPAIDHSSVPSTSWLVFRYIWSHCYLLMLIRFPWLISHLHSLRLNFFSVNGLPSRKRWHTLPRWDAFRARLDLNDFSWIGIHTISFQLQLILLVTVSPQSSSSSTGFLTDLCVSVFLRLLSGADPVSLIDITFSGTAPSIF